MLSDWSKPNRLRYYYLAAALCLALVPTSAQAQIYKSYDANGHPVYSGRPVRPTDKTYQVAGAGSLRVTRSVTGRSADYDDLIKQHSRLNGVRTDLVRAVVQVESGFNAF